MKIRIPEIRLLHVTIVALSTLLLVKSAAIVRAAAPASAPTAAGSAAPAAPEPAAAKPATPPKAPAAAAKPADAEKPSATPTDVTAKPAETAPPAVSDAERVLLLDLRQRRVELESRETSLATRENILASAEKRLAARLDELTTLQRRLEALENGRKEREDAGWAGLVKVYEGMKPREAALIFNDLDLPVLLQVVDRMKEAKTAPILAAMQPERARQVTTQLAELRNRRHALPQASAASPKAGS